MSRSSLFLPLERRITRRDMLLGLAASGIAAGAAFTSYSTARGRSSSGDDDELLDVCYWETVDTMCSNGRRLQYRCEVCCAGGICETVRCLWVDTEPC